MAEATVAFDLHVLGTPPALILSQDQTLMLNLLFGRSVSAAPSQLINASVDDLALCLRCFGLVSDADFAPYRRSI